MRIVIADDEPIALRRLETALLCIPEADLVGAARTGTEAAALIKDLKPDVVILDINMPGRDGIAVVEHLEPGEGIPEVIFVTAFDRHAVKAFELCAVDYLTKPVPFERLRTALERARERLAARDARQRFAEIQALIATMQDERAGGVRDDTIWVKTDEGMVRLPCDEIMSVRALGDYVEVVTRDRIHTLRSSISAMEKRLDQRHFVRCHRSAIVNVRVVRALRRSDAGKLSIMMDDGSSLAVGSTYTDSVLEKVKGKRARWGRT